MVQLHHRSFYTFRLEFTGIVNSKNKFRARERRRYEQTVVLFFPPPVNFIVNSFEFYCNFTDWISNSSDSCKHRNESLEETNQVLRVLAHQQRHFIYS